MLKKLEHGHFHDWARDTVYVELVLTGIWNWCSSYLLRDVYEDMQMDGVRPVRDTFHTLITGCMKGQRVQDVLYFFDEMKAMGLAPDVSTEIVYDAPLGSMSSCIPGAR